MEERVIKGHTLVHLPCLLKAFVPHCRAAAARGCCVPSSAAVPCALCVFSSFLGFSRFRFRPRFRCRGLSSASIETTVCC